MLVNKLNVLTDAEFPAVPVFQSLKTSQFSQNKDRVPKELLSSIVYVYQCIYKLNVYKYIKYKYVYIYMFTPRQRDCETLPSEVDLLRAWTLSVHWFALDVRECRR